MVFKAVSEKIDFDAVKESTTLTGEALAKKQARDKELEAIIKGEDDRTLLVIGPCSSDNEDAVLDYAHRLAKLQEEVKDKVFMVMRVYTAKPRTNGDGYKGLVHQPDAEGKPNLINGIKAVRNLHYRVITETGITTADEMLYPENLPLVDDLVSYIAIGARSVEDQQHRFVASGIDVPTGMKNPTSGNLNVMFNGIYAAQNKQNFLFNGEEVKHQVTHWHTLFFVVQRMNMVKTCLTSTMMMFLKPSNTMKKWVLKIHSSLLIQTMITQVNVTWNKSVSFVKP